MKKTLNNNKGTLIALVTILVIMVTAIVTAHKNRHATLASTVQSLSPEDAAEAETRAQSTRFILPSDPESRVRMPMHTKTITDWAPRHHRNYPHVRQ